jgi:Domain of unknown function (DUF1906)/Putative peptidoglycan binding domain
MLPTVSRRTRRASVLAALTVAVAGLLPATPGQAANRVTPGGFTGYGFDQCRTPSQKAMDAWLTSSPYWAVGVYIAGKNRYCGDSQQTHLTRRWVSTQLRKGWRILPITVGPQASCYVNPKKKIRIRTDPTSGYAKAREQGRLEARDTVRRARGLGISKRSTLWYDIEAYDIGNRRCRDSTLSFLTAWTRKLHQLGYVSGVYSSASSGIRALDRARVHQPGRFKMPDRVWVAEWQTADQYRSPFSSKAPSLYSAYLGDGGWMPRSRMRQYRGGHNETYGGVTINIDTNYLDLGRGTRAGRAPSFCRGTRVNFPGYRRLALGTRGAQVQALQCLLRQRGLYRARLTGHYDRRTQDAVRRYQRSHGVKASGRMLVGHWTMLLSGGRTPVTKIGSGGNHVRRVQRALNAATRDGLAVDGIFGRRTTRVVRAYQRQVGLRRTGVVDPKTWSHLQAGRH